MSLTPKNELTVASGLKWHVKNDAMQRWEPQIVGAANGIDILDVIGADMFGEGITAKSIKAELEARQGQDVTVNINSPGGDVFEGVAIYNLLRHHDGKVTANVLGIAASAASIIAMAADELLMPETSFLMIHNSWTIALGNKIEMRKVADDLDSIDQAMVGVYTSRTELSRDDVSAMMDQETFIEGPAAVEMGFADGILGADGLAHDEGRNAPEMRAVRVNELALRSFAPEMSRSKRVETMNYALSKGKDVKPRADVATQNAGLLTALSGLKEAMTA